MRFLHVADTHLGYSAYSKLDENGYNQRETDVYAAFAQVVDLALREDVDFVLHAGDLFDSVRPTNRAISFAVGQILRLTRAGIPFIVISGNHSTPKLRETGSVFRVLEHLDGVHTVYKGMYEKVVIGDCVIHAVPHCLDVPTLREEIKKIEIEPTAAYNIATFHLGIIGIDVFRTGEFNEQVVETSLLPKDMDYVALGHYHKYTEVAGNACYAGSTERFSFSEVEDEKGCIVVDLERGERKFHRLSIRPMVELEPVDCADLREEDVESFIEKRLKNADVKGKVVRLRVLNLPLRVKRSIDVHRLKGLCADALHFDVQFEVIRDEIDVQASSATFDSLSTEFERFLEQRPIAGLNKRRLLKMGIEYLLKASPEEV